MPLLRFASLMQDGEHDQIRAVQSIVDRVRKTPRQGPADIRHHFAVKLRVGFEPLEQVVELVNNGLTKPGRAVFVPAVCHLDIGLGLRPDDQHDDDLIPQPPPNLSPRCTRLWIGAMAGKALIQDGSVPIRHLKGIRVGEQRIPEILQQLQAIWDRHLGKISNARDLHRQRFSKRCRHIVKFNKHSIGCWTNVQTRVQVCTER